MSDATLADQGERIETIHQDDSDADSLRHRLLDAIARRYPDCLKREWTPR